MIMNLPKKLLLVSYHKYWCWFVTLVVRKAQGTACHVDPIYGKITTPSSYRIFLKLLIVSAAKQKGHSHENIC